MLKPNGLAPSVTLQSTQSIHTTLEAIQLQRSSFTAVIADSQRDEAGVGAEGMEAWSINPEPDMFPLI